ncbi:ATP-dependent DNA helicase [Nocardioides psychrotolerans]|uniref:DNA 3'-5' helicase n=1 Tax=Nocardioides psychrotolerans TaxID=1005945 RepID=A0A1I3L606_9ACTN|nr:ATP-dependent DNA helicase [Nocardioides psychrotolerans]GEP38808.1 ATP-dependent DNA helicase [Nocardioides psychrotolerans]SFI79946.1 DNA helicase-2 / ATP-dependent DNA helicase PcrA [Nocardioides psychrotolerans]
MTTTTDVTAPAVEPVTLDSPADLQRLMGTDYAVSDQQWAAVSAPLEPAVVIAGAGSGKTSLMAARVVYLVATGQVRPDEVLGLTFTTKAASELAHRIRAALADAGHGRGVTIDEDGAEEVLEPMVATYNAYASSLLAEHGLRIGHEPDTRVMADASRYQLAARVIDRHTGSVEQLSDSPKHVIDYILRLESALSEHLVDVDRLRAFDADQWPRFDVGLAGNKSDHAKVASAVARRAEALFLVDDYRRLKATLGLMDFSDQIALAARLADEHPVVGEVERGKYRIVLLDEYQDTSVAQALMLRRLFADGHPVTAVGDPNQAIYGWRGASVSNILRFGEDFPPAGRENGGDVTTFHLTVNRRSDQRILQVANRIAEPLYRQFPQVEPLESGTDAEGAVQTLVHETYADELAWLTDQVIASRGDADGSHWREIGVLVRDNNHAADVFDSLSSAGIPVEIVGLKGLLRLPEVSEVLATLTLIDDLTANAEVLTLLTGHRWAIGPRDLALLGKRAQLLAGSRRPARAGLSLADELTQAVAGADPTEVVALSDALDDPGEAAYSGSARERFALLSTELRQLRAHAGEPLLELVRRIIDTCGIDVELASSVSEAARARRENLDLFVKAVADFQAIDGTVTLPSLLAWLEAEDELGNGMDVATPSEADSVKLLTVHRAKGLEWDIVFLVGACLEKFPVTRSRGLWPTRLELLPTPLRGDARDLPVLRTHDKAGLTRLQQDTKEHEATEELRLAYVALTRARHRLAVSSYVWNEERKSPLGPSPYQLTIRATMASWGVAPLEWRDTPPKGTPNPLRLGRREFPWPVTERTAEALRRIAAAELVAEALADPEKVAVEDEELDLVALSRIGTWDDELDRLVAEARRERSTDVAVPLPSSLSATALARLRDDPDGFARDLVRPMPRPPSPAARFGTLFHAWVEARFGQQPLLDPDDLPGRGDLGIDDEADLDQLIEAFEQGPFGDRTPFAIESGFSLVLGGQVVRGRIDAVYAETTAAGEGFLLVDWKTNRAQTADALQLAIYRLAWAELHDVPLERVAAAFYYVRNEELVLPPDLPGREELEAILSLRP